MGYYIEVPHNRDKAQQLRTLHGATDVDLTWNAWDSVTEGKTLICVVENPLFDAAAIIYSKDEYKAFSGAVGSDLRRKTWLLLDTAKVLELCPSVGRVLDGPYPEAALDRGMALCEADNA
jgi:SAM-dependent MidA family methyltransferase